MVMGGGKGFNDFPHWNKFVIYSYTLYYPRGEQETRGSADAFFLRCPVHMWNGILMSCRTFCLVPFCLQLFPLFKCVFVCVCLVPTLSASFLLSDSCDMCPLRCRPDSKTSIESLLFYGIFCSPRRKLCLKIFILHGVVVVGKRSKLENLFLILYLPWNFYVLLSIWKWGPAAKSSYFFLFLSKCVRTFTST